MCSTCACFSGPSYVQLGGAFVEDTTQPAVASAVPHGADQITAPAHTASSAATHELAHCIPPASEAQEQPSNVGDGAKHGETRAVIAADMYAARSNAVQTTSCATAESVTQHTACKAGSSGPLKLENICQDDKASPGPSVTSAAGSGIISLAAVDASAADSNAAATAMPPHSHTAFEPAGVFCGAKDGFVFKLGDHGLGYYTDPTQSAMHAEHALPAEAAMSSELAKAPSLSTTHQKDLASPVKCNDRDCDMPQNVHKSLSGASSTINVSGDSRPDCEVAAAALLGENNITQVEGSHEQHYWGQALQYLDSAVQVSVVTV